MKKNLLLLLIALFCIVWANAQTVENTPLSNEEFFNQAELVIEGQFLRLQHTYNLKGTSNYEDGFEIRTVKVIRVYKGDQSLVGDTLYIASQGGLVGQEKSYDVGFTYGGDRPSLLIENGISGGINMFTPAIYFLVASDLPDDKNSKFASRNKYKYLKKYSEDMKYNKMFVLGDKVLGLNNLVFHNRTDFYNYMKQFRGFTVQEIPNEPKESEPKWINGAESNGAILDPERYEKMKVLMDSIQNEADKTQKKHSKKKVKENPKGNTDNNTLTLTLSTPESIYENGKWYAKFNVLATTNNPNLFLYETGMPIKYDKGVFGNLTLNKINFTFGTHFNVPGNDYGAMLFGLDGSFSVNFYTNTPTATKVKLNATPVVLLHFKIELPSNVSLTNCVSFSISQSDIASKYSLTSNSSTSYYYDKTYYNNTLVPNITNISPTSRIAGVGDILTIFVTQ